MEIITEYSANIKRYTSCISSRLTIFNGYIIFWKKFSSLKMVQGSFSSHMSSPRRRLGEGEDQRRQDFSGLNHRFLNPANKRPGAGSASRT